MIERLKSLKPWIKSSPCRRGCYNLDSDEAYITGGTTYYCSIVTNENDFFNSFYGDLPDGRPESARRFRNCSHKSYVD